MTRKSRVSLFPVGLLLLALSVLSACGALGGQGAQDKSAAGQSNSVKVGVISAQSGYAGDIRGFTLADAMFASIADRNAAGGIGGRKIEYVYADAQTSGDVAASITARYIEQDKVVAILGSISSSEVLAEISTMLKLSRQVPILSPAAAATFVEDPKMGFWHFSTTGSTDYVAKAMLTNIAKAEKSKKVGVLTSAVAFGKDFLKGLQSAAPAAGIDLVRLDEVALGVTDMTGPLRKLKDAGAEVLIGMVNPDDAVIAMGRGLKELGWKPQLWTLDMTSWRAAVAYPELFEGARMLIYADHRNPNLVAAIDRAKAAGLWHNEGVPDLFAMGYDAGTVLFSAMAKAKNPNDPAEVRDLIEKDTKDFALLSGTNGWKVTLSPEDHSLVRDARPYFTFQNKQRVWPN